MLDAWNRKIQAIQDAMKELWEDLVYKPLVIQAGIDEALTPELVWGKPDVISTSPKALVDQYTLLLNPALVAVTPQTRFDIENQLREALGFEQLPQALRPTQEASVAQTVGQSTGPQPLPASTYEKPPKPGKASKKTAGPNPQDGNGNQKAISEKIKELERNGRK
jgi:hypothetical protein